MYTPRKLEDVRRRQERAIRFVTGRTGYKTSPDDPDKCLRATYVIVMNDVPALLQAVELQQKWVKNLANALREAILDNYPNMTEDLLTLEIRNAMEGK